MRKRHTPEQKNARLKAIVAEPASSATAEDGVTEILLDYATGMTL